MTEPQSNKPLTAAEAFEAAGENLRQAEKAWSDTRVPDTLLGRAIDIANAWTALGVGLSGVLQAWTMPQKFMLGGATGEDELIPHTHSRPLCDHTWVAPMAPCANGCGARPEEGRSHLPCPKTCPDVTA